jgi:hypothetical protein
VVLPPQIIDGFTLNPSIRYSPYRYYASALAQLDILRRSNTYRAKLHVFPADRTDTPIPPYETREYQMRVTPNSYVWGLICNQFAVGDQRVPYATIPSTFLFQITDSCSGVPLFEDFAAAEAYTTLAGDNRNMMFPHLLPQPRLVLDPGLVTVEVANKDATNLYCQVVLFTAEPCEKYT